LKNPFQEDKLKIKFLVTFCLLLISVSAYSADTILGDFTTCWPGDKAQEYAEGNLPSDGKIKGKLGCKDFIIVEKGATNCKACNSKEQKCQGYVKAYCTGKE
jgi:hypothetical protein